MKCSLLKAAHEEQLMKSAYKKQYLIPEWMNLSREGPPLMYIYVKRQYMLGTYKIKFI